MPKAKTKSPQLNFLQVFLNNDTKRIKLAEMLLQEADNLKYIRFHTSCWINRDEPNAERFTAILDTIISDMFDLAAQYKTNVDLTEKVQKRYINAYEPLSFETLSEYYLKVDRRLYAKLGAFTGIVKDNQDVAERIKGNFNYLVDLSSKYRDAV